MGRNVGLINNESDNPKRLTINWAMGMYIRYDDVDHKCNDDEELVNWERPGSRTKERVTGQY